MDEVELATPLLVLHEEVELKLSVSKSVLEARRLKSRVRVRKEYMGLGSMETEGLAFGFVLYVDVLQLLVHHFGKRLCLLLVDLLILELEVEMLLRLFHLSEADEEFRLDPRLCLGLMYGVHELRFVQFLAGHGDDAVDF